jgi:putative ABC transport system permease protein
MSWLGRMAHPERAEQQLDAELRFDYDQRVAAHVRRGMSEAEARRAVRLEFGGLEQVKEECRDARELQFLHSFARDLSYALRGMRRSPGFTVVAVITLALGIGINAAVFTAMNAVLFRGFPLVERNDRILYITNSQGCCVSWPDFEDWRAQAKSFEGMGIVHGIGVVLSDKSGFTERCDATEVSSNTFQLIGRRPIMGRDFAPPDGMPGAAPVVILTWDFWERRYAKDTSIVGRTVRMNGVPATIIGVMPQGFSFPQKQDFWVPLVPTPEVRKRENREAWFVFGRMAQGVTAASARAEMATIAKRLAIAYPLTNRDSPAIVQNFAQFFIGPNAATIYGSLWGAVGFVLLIACANLANLMLARSIGRSREISIRIALGAGRWRIVRQFFIESLILSVFGGLCGWWLAKWSVRAWELVMTNRSSWMIVDYTMDYRVLGYLIAISIGTGLLFGMAPALRLAKIRVNETLKDGDRASTGGSRGKHLSAVLVVAEMALAVVLLAGAGVMIHSFLNVYTADLGVKTSNILITSLGLPALRYPRADQQVSFYGRLQKRLEAIPGVESVALADRPLMWAPMRFPYELAGEPPVDAQRRPKIPAMTIGPGYFKTMGAAMISGRDFDDADGPSGSPVVIVNQWFANKHWPGQNPLGKRLRLFNSNTPESWLTVVGLASNIAQNDPLRQEMNLVIYVPYLQKPTGSMWLIARTSVPPASLATAFRRAVQAMDPDLPSYGPITLAKRVELASLNNGYYAALFLIFAAIALLLASIGLYAVASHSVSRRTQEIGIRIAMGATARDVLRLVFRQGMLPVGIGLIIGLLASFAVNGVLKSELVQVSPVDPATLAAVSTVLILSAMLGCLIPARRGMRVDPAVALRHE